MPDLLRFRSRPAAICAGLSFSIVLLAAAPAEAELFEAEPYTLKNGMEVVVLLRHPAPVVFQVVVYKVGAADGAPAKNGVAHFLEHLMFKRPRRWRLASSARMSTGWAARTTPSPTRT